MTNNTQQNTQGAPPATPQVTEANPADTFMIPLREVVLMDRYQIRAKTDPGTIARYRDAMAVGTAFPPVIVAKVGKGLVLVDGWHRFKAAQAADLDKIEAMMTDAQEHELRWIAAQANMKNGQPMKSSEARGIFRAYVNAGQHLAGRGKVKSARTIAADLQGIRSHVTLLAWMKKDFNKVYRQMAEEGRMGIREAQPAEQMSSEEAALNDALAAVQDIASKATIVTDPDKRGALVAALEDALRSVKADREYAPENKDF